MRSDPALYPKMSVLKVGFYRELLSFGYNVWACDADAVFMNDPRSTMREKPWDLADIAIATDCMRMCTYLRTYNATAVSRRFCVRSCVL